MLVFVNNYFNFISTEISKDGNPLEVELIQNCVKDIMEDYETKITKKFFNLHWGILDSFYEQKVNMLLTIACMKILQK